MQRTSLEKKQKLSDSVLWSKLRTYYLNLGIDAWRTGAVPSFITSNVFIGNTYANLIFSYIKDHINLYGNANNEPFYIIEVGAGHAKLSFYLVKALVALCNDNNISTSSFKYIITDLAKRNTDYWQTHHAIKPYIEANIIDYAVFDAVNESSITLLHSKKTLTKGSLSKPIAMVGNYIIDTLPHDAFQVRNGVLYEALISTDLVTDGKIEITSSNILNHLKHSFDHKKITSNYYEDLTLNNILAEYEDIFEDASLLIPIGGITCINTIKSLSTSDFFLICADKGDASTDHFSGLVPPFIEADDYAALMVNFDALARYFTLQDGFALTMAEESSTFQVLMCSTAKEEQYPLLCKTYNEKVFDFSPLDYFSLENRLGIECKKPSLPLIIAIIKLSRCDPHIFHKFRDKIIDKVDSNEKKYIHDLAKYADRIWDNFFHLDEEDIPFELGRLLYYADQPEKAIKFYKLSLEYFGSSAACNYNLALSYLELSDYQNALFYLGKVKEEDPNYEEVQTWYADVQKKLAEITEAS